MAQRDLTQTRRVAESQPEAGAARERVRLTPEERERLDRAVAHIDDPQSRDIARRILEDYRETFEYLKDK